ncbi:MAG TPA: ABC transporter permease [Gaiellaceae bacterium]
MSGARLVLHQFRYDQKTFWRNPAATFFAVVLPVMFLFIFVSIFGNKNLALPGHGLIKGSTYYLPGIVTLGVISTTFTNLAISLTVSRERGLLKRLRKTPLPTWAFLTSRTGTSAVTAVLLFVVLVAIGRVVYGVSIPGQPIVGALLALFVGAFSFAALGFALTGAIGSENAAAPITNFIILPLYFISGVFIPDDQIPSGVRSIAGVFPVKRLYEAFLKAFDPTTTGTGIDWTSLAIVAAWGVAGALVAVKTFRWSPRSG